VLPSALNGIINGVILSVGRCFAETAAIILTAGNALRARTMAIHIYMLAMEQPMDMADPEGFAFGTAALLIIFILIINVGANALVNRFVSKGTAQKKRKPVKRVKT